MRVLLSAYACEPNRGSEPGNGWNWAAGLARAGHQVDLLTREEHRGVVDAAIRGEGLPIRLRTTRLSEHAQSLPHAFRVYAPYIQFQQRVRSLVRDERPMADVAHHVTWGTIRFGTGLDEIKAPLVVGPVGGGQVAPDELAAFLGSNRAREAARTSLNGRLALANPAARRAAKRASLVLATNSESASQARSLGARRVELMLADAIPNMWLRPRRRSPGNPTVLWVGRLLPIKGAPLAVEAFELVHDAMPEARLVMVGDGPTRPDVEQTIERLGLVNSVELTGQIPWTDVLAYYDEASVFLFTSIRDSFGAQVLEAASRGLPAVAFDKAGVRDFLPDDAGLKVPVAGDQQVRRLATAVLQLLQDQALWLSCSDAALGFASRNTWPARIQQAEELYEQVAGTR